MVGYGAIYENGVQFEGATVGREKYGVRIRHSGGNQRLWGYEENVYLHFVPHICCDLIFPVATANSAGHLCTLGIKVIECSVAYRWWTNLYFCCHFPFIRLKSNVSYDSLYWQIGIKTNKLKSASPLLLTRVSAWIKACLARGLFLLGEFVHVKFLYKARSGSVGSILWVV